MMKKLFLFLNLFFILFVLGAGESFANKKYRYIKREHGIRFQGNIPMSLINQGFSAGINLTGAYAYNWKGMVEVGPYFDLGAGMHSGNPFQLRSWSAGLLAEYNFIKNRGKRKFIPSLGLTVGTTNQGLNLISKDHKNNTNILTAESSQGLNLTLGVHISLKHFVAKRTAFITTLGYSLHTPFNNFFKIMNHHGTIGSIGFSYYFDFY